MDGDADSRRHYPALDGLRGIVAISVVLFHVGRWLHVAGLASNSGLAVDFFFCLSGFVVTHAYRARLDQGMSFSDFMAVRLRRLLPLAVLATLISAAFAVLRSVVKHEPIPPSQLAASVLLGVLNLPNFDPPETLGDQLFPLNGPQYTLFLEIFINAFWASAALFRGRLFAIAVSLVAFVLVALPGEFGGDVAASFLMGFPRVFAAFYAGVLAFDAERKLRRSQRRDTLFWCSLGLTLLMFYAPVKTPFWLDVAWIGVVIPLIVFAGARIELGTKIGTLGLFLGGLSYPLYILHYPVFCWVNGAYQYLFGAADNGIEAVLFLISASLISVVALYYFDLPIRRVLSSFTGSGATRPAGGR